VRAALADRVSRGRWVGPLLKREPVFALRASRTRFGVAKARAAPRQARQAKRGGARRDRTDDLMLAKHALSQLSYGPVSLETIGAPLHACELCRARFASLMGASSAARLRHAEPAGRSVVGLGRLELPTSRLSSARSNQLSYKPLAQGAIACAPARAG
jgi:hypothetical protein